jgi:hypothetical protein
VFGLKMRILKFFGIVTIMTLIGGCGAINRGVGSINTKIKEKEITTGLFNKNIGKMSDAVKAINTVGIGKMTKSDVARSGFEFNAQNVECLRGAVALPYIVGNVQNNIDLSTSEKIDAYAKTVDAYEACIFREHRTQSKSPRFYLSKGKTQTKGDETVFIITFKDGILYRARESVRKPINESQTEQQWGGNTIETLIGIGTSVRKF